MGREEKMKIAVFADTHGRSGPMLSLIERLRPDHVIHLGDYLRDGDEICDLFPDLPTTLVAGNNDLCAREPSEKWEKIGGRMFYLSHGHQFPAQARERLLLKRAAEGRAELVLFGHTHVGVCREENGVWLLNPGSLCLPRDGKKSFALIELSEKGVAPTLEDAAEWM